MLIFLFFLISKLISCQKENNSYLIEEATPYLFTIGPHEIFFQQYDTSFQYRFFYFNALEGKPFIYQYYTNNLTALTIKDTEIIDYLSMDYLSKPDTIHTFSNLRYNNPTPNNIRYVRQSINIVYCSQDISCKYTLMFIDKQRGNYPLAEDYPIYVYSLKEFAFKVFTFINFTSDELTDNFINVCKYLELIIVF